VTGPLQFLLADNAELKTAFIMTAIAGFATIGTLSHTDRHNDDAYLNHTSSTFGLWLAGLFGALFTMGPLTYGYPDNSLVLAADTLAFIVLLASSLLGLYDAKSNRANFRPMAVTVQLTAGFVFGLLAAFVGSNQHPSHDITVVYTGASWAVVISMAVLGLLTLGLGVRQLLQAYQTFRDSSDLRRRQRAGRELAAQTPSWEKYV
jgi:hypothetical protein